MDRKKLIKSVIARLNTCYTDIKTARDDGNAFDDDKLTIALTTLAETTEFLIDWCEDRK